MARRRNPYPVSRPSSIPIEPANDARAARHAMAEQLRKGSSFLENHLVPPAHDITVESDGLTISWHVDLRDEVRTIMEGLPSTTVWESTDYGFSGFIAGGEQITIQIYYEEPVLYFNHTQMLEIIGQTRRTWS